MVNLTELIPPFLPFLALDFSEVLALTFVPIMVVPVNAIVNLGSERTGWKVKVWVVRLWRRQCVLISRKVVSLDMVFLDEDVS